MFKIIADSSCDLKNDYINEENIEFQVVPLSIHVDGKEFIDDENLNVETMLKAQKEFSGKSTSSCPSPGSFAESFTADYNFCFTISSKLSGVYNSANLAKNIVDDKKVFILDSKLTAGAIALLVDETVKLIKQGLEYDEICAKLTAFRDSLHLYFVLDSFDNLVKNGRMSKLSAIVAKIAKIKPLCIGLDGEIKVHKMIRTRSAALDKMVEEISNESIDFENLTCIISHANDLEEATSIKTKLEETTKFKEIVIRPMRGLCSFYALEKGIIVSF